MDDPCDEWVNFSVWLRKRKIEKQPHYECRKCGEVTPDFAMSTVIAGYCDTCAQIERGEY